MPRNMSVRGQLRINIALDMGVGQQKVQFLAGRLDLSVSL